MRDMKSTIDVVPSLAPAARTDGTATGSAADLQGYQGAMAVFKSGNWTDGTHTPSLQDSDDGTTYAAVGTDDMAGTFTPLSGTADENAAQRVNYIGTKRYLRGMIVTASSTTGALSDMSIVRGRPAVAPLA